MRFAPPRASRAPEYTAPKACRRVTESVDGSLRVGPSTDAFKKQMKAAEDVINRYRNTLRELAK